MTDDEFREFYASTAPALHGYLARIGGDHALADDLVQVAYVRLLRARSLPADERARRVYIYRIALNLLRDERRRAARLERRLARATSEEQEGEIDAGGLATETRIEVRRALAEIGDRDGDLLWMAYAVGMTHRELAGVFGVAEPSVRVLLLRARRKFARVLDVRGIGPDVLEE
jgi:RNA polymerase sigma-70 factor (ECF subfamily)